MIRMIQRRLIIPRGDTGSFSIPYLKAINPGDVAVFTIFDIRTKTKMYQKLIAAEGDILNIAFTHGDTVNLKPGKYLWDIKFYTNPQIIDDELVNGDEVDSYYAGFSLPECEIRETGDTLLTSDDAPTSKISPESLNIINAAINEILNTKRAAVEAAETAGLKADAAAESAEDASNSAAAASQSAALAEARVNEIENLSVEVDTGLEGTDASVTYTPSTGVLSFIIPRGNTGNGIASCVLNNDFTLTINYTNGDSTTTIPIRGDTPHLTIGEVTEGPHAIATITGTDANPILNLTLPNANVPTKLSQLTDDIGVAGKANSADLAAVATSGSYTDLGDKPYIPVKTSDLTNDSNYAVDSNYIHTDNNYTTAEKNKLSGIAAGAEVNVNADWNAASGDAYILNKPTKVSQFTNDAGYLSTEIDPTVPAWAKAAQKPSYTAAEVGAPTVAEMNTAIGTAIGNINSFDMAVVQTLPTQDISTHTIYLVPKTGETNDVYDEYVYINNAWEMVGNTQIDLSDYALKSELPTKVSELSNDSGYLTSYTETDPTVPQWAKAATKPSYTATEVGALPSDTHIPSTTAELTNDAGFITSADLPTKVSDLTNDAGYLTQHQDISGKANSADLAAVATSGSYNDLINKPSIPSKVSDLTDDSGHYTKPATGIPASDLSEEIVSTIDGKAPAIWKDANGFIVHFEDGAEDMPLRECKVQIEPVQEGTGDPSPENVRPITGWTGATISHSGADTADPDEISITFPTEAGTVYGGTLDVVRGTLIVNRAMVDLGTLTWSSWLENGTYIFNAIVDEKKQKRASTLICSQYKPNYSVSTWSNLVDCEITGSNLNTRVYIRDQRFTDNAAFTAAMSGVQLVYELETPITYTLTPQEIRTLLGTNNIWADTGDTAITYPVDTKMFVEQNTPDVPVQDVQVNGVSVLDAQGVANVPVVTASGTVPLGLVKPHAALGTAVANNGSLAVVGASTNQVKIGANEYNPIMPNRQHIATFYGLAKAAGADMKDIANTTVGIYPDAQKEAIQSMLGISQMLAPENPNLVASQAYAIGDVFAANGHLYKATAAIAQDEAIIPDTNCVETTMIDAVLINKTLTVTVLTQDNVTVTGQTVTVRADDASGEVYAIAAYEGQPVSFSLPSGFQYYVSVSDTLNHHFNPTTARGVITNTDVAVTLTYSDFSTIHTATDIKAALNAGMNLTDLVGEQITCAKGSDTLTWDVVDYNATNKNVTLLLHDVFGTANMVFEPAQALMWCENGLAAGSYTFKWNATQVYFTLTTAIPAGGQLRANNSSFWTYESQSATTTLETGTVSTTEIAGATDLGKTGEGLLNHHDRVSYGSNNFAESALYWWLNSDAAANTQRVPVTKFSCAYSYAQPGFLNGLDANFVAVLDNTEWLCACNNVYECPESLGGYTKGKGQTYTVTSKIGLASEMEIFGSYGGNQDGSTIYDLYNGAEATDRIKYRGTSAQVWWLRSPYWSFASSERYVHSSGGAYYVSAYSSYGVVPACRISRTVE